MFSVDIQFAWDSVLGGKMGTLENYINTRHRPGPPGKETQLIKMKL